MSDNIEDVHAPARTEPKPIKLRRSRDEATREGDGMNLAASWYVAMPSSRLGRSPMAVELFGKDLVAWRDRNGHPVLMDRYCSHLGMNLSLGKIVDGCIQCPAHHWKFDRSGQCVANQGWGEPIPKTAHQRTYELVERCGYIWVWYGTQSPLFPLPTFQPMGEASSGFLVSRFMIDTKTTVRKIIEDGYDILHMSGLHNIQVSAPIRLTIDDEDHPVNDGTSPVAQEARFAGRIEFDVKQWYGIPGILANALGISISSALIYNDTWPSGHCVRVLLDGVERYQFMVCVTPVSKNRTIQHVVNATRKTRAPLMDRVRHAGFTFANFHEFHADLPLWNTTNPGKGGAYTKFDKGILGFRSFYQSWVDKVEWDESPGYG